MTNTFLKQKFLLTGNWSYSNWHNAANDCYRNYECEIRAMFGDDGKHNKYNFYSFLNPLNKNTTINEKREESNGLAHLKFKRYFTESDGTHTSENYYCRCLFPKDDKVTIKWREEFNNLQYFILFISGDRIGYIDNNHNNFKQLLAKKANKSEFSDKYQSIKIGDLTAAGICKTYSIYFGANNSLIDEQDLNAPIIQTAGIVKKLSNAVFLQYDPKPLKKYVCYDGKTVTNKNMKQICTFLNVTYTKKHTDKIREYINKTSELVSQRLTVCAYGFKQHKQNLTIFNKGLFNSNEEVIKYCNESTRNSALTDQEKNYRNKLSKKLSRCKSKADFDKRFSDEDKVYIVTDQVLLAKLNLIP